MIKLTCFLELTLIVDIEVRDDEGTLAWGGLPDVGRETEGSDG